MLTLTRSINQPDDMAASWSLVFHGCCLSPFPLLQHKLRTGETQKQWKFTWLTILEACHFQGRVIASGQGSHAAWSQAEKRKDEWGCAGNLAFVTKADSWEPTHIGEKATLLRMVLLHSQGCPSIISITPHQATPLSITGWESRFQHMDSETTHPTITDV